MLSGSPLDAWDKTAKFNKDFYVHESKCFGDLDVGMIFFPARDAESRKFAWEQSEDRYKAFIAKDAQGDIVID